MKSSLTVPVNGKTKFICTFAWNEKKNSYNNTKPALGIRST